MNQALKPRFETYIGIDYSGAGHRETRTSSLRIFLATPDQAPTEVVSPASKTRRRNWNRLEVSQWLAEFLASHDRVIAGVDHGFSFPVTYFERYQLNNWDAFLADFVSHWPTHCAKITVDQLRQDSKRNGDSSEFRLTERWTSSAKSTFQFDVQGSVAKSTHCGIPFLAKLRHSIPRLHVWPFDGFSVEAHRSVIAEVYPSLFRKRYDRARRSVDQQDAYSVCRWLRETDRQFGLDRYFQPPLTAAEKARAKLEGWILGVG